MSQAAIDWLEDEETQWRITALREFINDYANHEGFISLWPSMEACVTYLREECNVTFTDEEIEFVDLKSYFRE